MGKRFKVFSTVVPTKGDQGKNIRIWGYRYDMPVMHAKQDLICWKREDSLYDCEMQLVEMTKEEERSERGGFMSRHLQDIVQRDPIGTFSGVSITDPCMQEHFRYEGKADFPKKYNPWKKEWELENRDAIAVEIHSEDLENRYPCDISITTSKGNTVSVRDNDWISLVLECFGEEGKEIECKPKGMGWAQMKRDEMLAVSTF